MGSLMSCANTMTSLDVQGSPLHGLAGATLIASGRRAMRFMFGRREKFLYKRNPMLTSFLSGTKFGMVVAVLLLIIVKLN